MHAFRTIKNVCNHINGIRVTTEPVKILGIYLGHNKEQCLEKNWQSYYVKFIIIGCGVKRI